MAPSLSILRVVVDASRKYIEKVRKSNEPGTDVKTDLTLEELKATDSIIEEQIPSLIGYPHGDSAWRRLAFVCLFPFRCALHYTIPDPRIVPTAQVDQSVSIAWCSATSCIIWIVASSYLLVVVLEALGRDLGIPDSIVGITFSAAGTSIPNYMASKIAAEQGLGNMAVASVFGSNVFLIFVGLGLPWTLYTAIDSADGIYSGLKDDGISESILIMSAALSVFVVLMVLSDFMLYKWHAYVFCGLYAIYLMYVCGSVYFEGIQ